MERKVPKKPKELDRGDRKGAAPTAPPPSDPKKVPSGKSAWKEKISLSFYCVDAIPACGGIVAMTQGADLVFIEPSGRSRKLSWSNQETATGNTPAVPRVITTMADGGFASLSNNQLAIWEGRDIDHPKLYPIERIDAARVSCFISSPDRSILGYLIGNYSLQIIDLERQNKNQPKQSLPAINVFANVFTSSDAGRMSVYPYFLASNRLGVLTIFSPRIQPNFKDFVTQMYQIKPAPPSDVSIYRRYPNPDRRMNARIFS